MLDLVILASEAGEYVDPSVGGFNLLNGTFFVSVAMLILIGIVLYKKVPAIIGASLDRKIASIKAELDQAHALRADAEKLRAEYEAKLAAATQEAADMNDRAEADAEAILAKARTDAENLIVRRQKMATDKIAAAERAAIAEIRSKVALAATGAAASLIAENHNADADKSLVDQTVAQLGARLN
ncbi:F0F1 ATP synthase subunit B family protein [Blastomonas aquatica]|uniref:ATP synthase subunit b n=1 Tax=Blastomonas aquatica TaxID=1510276 RepID=A0ABQ1J2T0_9SPHN|nr:F0F1 ATP synthase subunit B [Blastomonas aquatica]GGB58714.1 ATP synthase subunit b [Blastomonas aquatica]